MSIILIDPFVDKRWDEFVLRHPEGTIFHTSAWAKVLQERYNTSPTYYAVETKWGEITAIAPFFRISSPLGGKRLVCLPCSEYCFPIGDNQEDVEKLIFEAEKEVSSKSLSYLEIRGNKNGINFNKLSLTEYPYYLNHVTPLSKSISDLKAELSRDTRYHINRGERSPVKVREAQSEEDLKYFHQLTSSMRRRINLLPWPYRFFQSIYRHLILAGYGYLLLAEVEGKIVSGGLFFCYKNNVINKFNASDVEFIQLRTNYLLMWKAIERAYENKYGYFDFGVTNPENVGLTKFKRHWGSQELTLPYYYYPSIRGLNSAPETSLIYRAHTTINKLLPDFALKLAAEMLYKRLG